MRALLLIFSCLSFSAFAGTMQLAGEVKALTAETMEVSDGNHVYVIKRSAIKNKSARAKSVKVGSQVEVTVADDGIVETKNAPPAR